uniref:Retrotransposon protein, putative, unclassified n=1 Tax=Oryza sativa subsp. japonica TaxID=39947 RepID=Q9AYG5_ORYSJ|nr:Hypothetical protein [Oryza sativa Japonica Group]
MHHQYNVDSTSPTCRKPSDIDPSGKDPEPTDKETDSATAKETRRTEENRPTDSQSATDNVETGYEPPTGSQLAEAKTSASQEPPTGDQPETEPNRDIPETEGQASSPPLNDTNTGPGVSSFDKVQGPARPPPKVITAEDSRPPILVKWWDDEMQPQGIVINKQKEDEEVSLLAKTLNQATRLVNIIHLRNEAKTATLEKLVPHLGTLEETRAKLHETKELARKTEHNLMDRVAALQEVNFELSGSSKDRKIKSQAQFEVLVNKIKKLEGARDEVANAGTLLIQAMFFNNNGPSFFDAVKVFDKLRTAPDIYFKNIREAGSMGASMALAMTKSLYPKIDVDAIDDFANGTSEEDALELISDAQKAADKIAVDVVERFQDTNLGPTGADVTDDEKTESD